MRQLHTWIVITMVLLAGGCMHGRGGVEPPGNLPLPDPALVATGRPEYRIGPNDLLNVVVFQIADLERDVRVDNRGDISLPLIGSVPAAGKSVQELQELIAAQYGARFLESPQVSVFIKEFSRQRVTVEGAVGAPGIYPIDTRLSLLQAIALAKGPTNIADERDVIVFRTIGDMRHIARFDLKAIRDGSAPDPEVLGEDVVVVAESGAKAWFRRLIEVTPLIGVWSVFQ